jgi:hypothetical protein
MKVYLSIGLSQVGWGPEITCIGPNLIFGLFKIVNLISD